VHKFFYRFMLFSLLPKGLGTKIDSASAFSIYNPQLCNSLSAGQMSIRIIFPDSVFKNPIIFIFYKYVLFMDKIAVFLILELLELIFHGNYWKNPHFETFKLRK